MVYQNNTLPTKMVDVYSGYTSTASGNATAIYRFGTTYQGGPAHFFVNALAGQLGFSDDFYVNGTRVSGILGGGGKFLTDGVWHREIASPRLRHASHYFHRNDRCRIHHRTGNAPL